MPTLSLHWNRCRGDVWGEFFSVDLDDRHFDGLEGVFVVWMGGSQPAAIAVGLGRIRDALKELRADPALAAYEGKTLLVSWAKVEQVARAGVARYLSEALKPRIAPQTPPAAPIEINAPGRGEAAPADVGAPPPRQSRDPRAEPEPAAPKPKPAAEAVASAEAACASLVLQKTFAEMMRKAQEPGKSGFFGGTAKPRTPEEGLVVELVQIVFREALKMRASDVHLEPMDSHLRVRFRLDGMLEEVLQIPHHLNLRVVSHVRVMCGLDPEKGVGSGRPEDGRMAINIDNQEADLRLSTFPTSHGDKAVLRLIPRTNLVPTLGEMGLEPKAAEALQSLIVRPQGMFVVTGPTGSGKSTTLYTILQSLNDPTRNIVTLEDPVEKKIPGVSQGPIQPKAGFGFAEGLRAILRQDPNVIMVGEVRDKETAEIALSASLTGHMLFTTLHTSSALGAITRLVDMGLEPFLIASALTAVSAQRLARAVCDACARPYEASRGEMADAQARARKTGIALPEGLNSRLRRGEGCDRCRGTGYMGRALLFELAVMTPPLREMVLRKGSIDDLKAAAASGGMETLLLDGLRKAASGRTTLSEVLRVVDACE
ncbi:MAG: hypothetical protein A2V88_15510 [Elusimicrobia bacterium RBG_16_66_12]|nr:MAG: hypothetical protein A2V88_15510 [Elusimicrobia bacterium RBG_16_66_12]